MMFEFTRPAYEYNNRHIIAPIQVVLILSHNDDNQHVDAPKITELASLM